KPGPKIDGPDADGFYGVQFFSESYNAGYGRMLCRPEGERLARVRIAVGPLAANLNGALHGGFMMSFLDQALFTATRTLGDPDAIRAVTLGLSTQFLTAGRMTEPLDCIVEVVRETGRLLFLRGTMEQSDDVLLTFQATLRKMTPRKA